MKNFAARRIDAVELQDLNTFVVFLYERENGSGQHIELQRALVFDEQDVENGMDTYCVVIDDATHYGGVSAWELASGYLQLDFDEAAARVFGTPRLTIDLNTSEEEVGSMVAALERVFAPS